MMRAPFYLKTMGLPQRAAALLLLAVLMLAGSPFRAAQAQTGGAAVVFLMIEPDSRSAGLGNAGVALADNASAIFWNPAGLAFQRGAELSLTHSNWLPEFNAGLFYEYLVGKYHVDGLGTFGAHITYLNLGEHDYRDGANESLGTFKSYDLAVGASYGFNVTENLAIGTGLRLIYSNLAGGVAVEGQEAKAGVSAGFDLGALYKTPSFSLGGTQARANFGFNLANMGPTIQYADDAQADPIPTNLRFGYSLTFDFDEYNSLTLVNDFTKMLTSVSSSVDSTSGEVVRTREVDPWYQAIFSAWSPINVDLNTNDDTDDPETLSAFQQLIIGFGAEYWYNKLFAFRTGYFYENPYNGNRQFLTFGAGVRYNLIGVDFSYIYALEEDHPLSNTMRFSLLLNIAQ